MVRDFRFFFGMAVACFAMACPANAGAEERSMGPLSPIEISDRGTSQLVELPVGKARIIKLPVDARDALVADPSVADVVIKTPRLAYLLGRRVGATNAFFFDGDGNEIARLEIDVQIDLVSVREAFDKLMPGTHVEVRNLSTTLRHRRFLFTDSFLLLWKWRVG